jgi:hypothetical protein
VLRSAAILLVLLGAPAAWACTCESLPPDLAANLETAKERARHIYLVRVGARAEPTIKKSQGTFSGEVLEVFKGAVEKGAKLSFHSGDGASCRFLFAENSLVLVYGLAAEPEEVSMCSRSRRVEADDAELTWLRKGVLPRIPAVARREVVSCERCDLQSVANRIFDAPAENGGMPKSFGIRLVGNLKRMGPFWTTDGEGPARADEALALGKDPNGGFFQLRQYPSWTADGQCEQRVERRDCDRLMPILDAGTARPYFRCFDAGTATQVCDERESRTARWEPVETFAPVECKWRDPVRPVCELPATMEPVDAGVEPIAQCHPAYGYALPRYTCVLR